MMDRTETIMVLLLILTALVFGCAVGMYIHQGIKCPEYKPIIKTINTAPVCYEGELLCVQRGK